MRRRYLIIAAVLLAILVVVLIWVFVARSNSHTSSSGNRSTATTDNAASLGTASDGTTYATLGETSDSGPVPMATTGDADAGKDVFAAKCAVCHSLVSGEKATGPSLIGVFGQPAATVDKNFAFTKDLMESQKTWDPATLDAFLADPDGFIPGTTMLTKLLPHGAPDATQRANLITFLASLKPDTAYTQP